MIGELFSEFVVKPVLEVACYWTGKPIVQILSLGSLHVEFRDPDAKQRRSGPWYAITFMDAGRRYVDAQAVTFIGLVFWALVTIGVLLLARRA